MMVLLLLLLLSPSRLSSQAPLRGSTLKVSHHLENQ